VLGYVAGILSILLIVSSVSRLRFRAKTGLKGRKMHADRDAICAMARYSLGDGPLSDAALGQVGGYRDQHWCGLWLLWIYQLAGVTDVQWVTGFSLPRAMRRVQQTAGPRPGDFGIVRQRQHHVLVTGVEWRPKVAVVHTIAGNTGLPPGVVDEHDYQLHDTEITWFSIQPYLDSAYLESEKC
jgi:hypothetical protein